MTSAMDIASIDAHGPSTIAAIATPTACPVVPPGSGRLNIMMMKENAANTDSSGTIRVFSTRFIFCSDMYQNGADPAYRAAHVPGPRYPSGMCIFQAHV